MLATALTTLPIWFDLQSGSLMNSQSRWMVCVMSLIYDTFQMSQFDRMVEHGITWNSIVAHLAVDPRGIGDQASLYNVISCEVPLANSPDLTMALIVGQVINKHCSTSVSRTRTLKLIDFKSGHFPCLSPWSAEGYWAGRQEIYYLICWGGSFADALHCGYGRPAGQTPSTL